MNNDMQGEMKRGGCSMCAGHRESGMCGQHHWMHIIIKIFVALFIFWAGVQFGELKSVIKNAYYGGGYGMMNAYGGERGQTYFLGGPGMMSNWGYTTASGATTTKK